jgi:hypothetical protein
MEVPAVPSVFWLEVQKLSASDPASAASIECYLKYLQLQVD